MYRLSFFLVIFVFAPFVVVRGVPAHSVPSIQPCASLPTSPNGHWNDDGVARLNVGAHNEWHCEPGFISVPSHSVLTCQTDSQWDEVVPRCDPCGPLTCAGLAIIPNGHWEFSTNCRAKMRCDDGYSLVGDEVLTCINAQWDNPLPRCDPLRYTSKESPSPCGCPAPSHDIPKKEWKLVNFTCNKQFSPIIHIGFDYKFFGRSYSRLLVSPNGFITFDTSSTNPLLPLGITLPNDDLSYKTIIAYWATELESLADGALTTYATVGDDGSRKFVLKVSNVPYLSHPDSTDRLSVEVALHENDGEVEHYYHHTPNEKQKVTVGIQDTHGGSAQAALGGEQSVVALEDKSVSWQQEHSEKSSKSVIIAVSVICSVVVVGVIAILIWRRLAKKRSPSPVMTPSNPTANLV